MIFIYKFIIFLCLSVNGDEEEENVYTEDVQKAVNMANKFTNTTLLGKAINLGRTFLTLFAIYRYFTGTIGKLKVYKSLANLPGIVKDAAHPVRVLHSM